MKYNQFFAELTAAGCYVALSRHGKQEVPTGMERKARKVLLGD